MGVGVYNVDVGVSHCEEVRVLKYVKRSDDLPNSEVPLSKELDLYTQFIW